MTVESSSSRAWWIVRRWRVVVAAVTTAAATVLATRHRHRDVIELPDPATSVTETAASVRNAARGAVIQAVRESDHPTQELVVGTALAAVDEGLRAGVDILAPVVGVVEGAADIAHLLDRGRRDLARSVAEAVLPAAEERGPVALARVRTILASLDEDA
ncbi:MAG TPA: hypothetical protein VLB67_14455 [Acidimicrobiia bacterium]|nr:hypothetical protein [Acidimicrobiia bacterium]